MANRENTLLFQKGIAVSDQMKDINLMAVSKCLANANDRPCSRRR